MKGMDELRKEYSKASLDISDVNKDPIGQFDKWFKEALAAGIPEPNAFTLSTISEGGRPSARIVLLKGLDQRQFVFYTNYQSQKGKELDSNPACALTFFWPELERQVRIEGIATRVQESTSEQYFQSRPRGSQIGAWASPQSSIIANRDILEAREREIEKKFEGLSLLPKPKQWGGFAITPIEIEFWQGRASRLHDRVVYYLTDEKWIIHRLAP
ncbi:MAG: pyridoxamine 5'-phosphate oxidase [Cytophagales bacterium]|nr:pyridoxamine 5'-phosphate oxidase [Cytophagales bacterium]MCA6389201.1 pyridoxamine 5'-phosphate oxidase [Cytophagales bacterium]MCA6390350.1 pyridoxamine 5'-phosphate oxidase [Cytophagales bacterium]MCA6399790.1 pyridoxamine 5'-phosphate oxidase [Cytophagales bacterium]MCA6403463.1 pyridoxamine 5'-phosphate oxidase [Cytophagales bacterium]